MRKLVYAINLTLDSVCDHTKGTADAETHEFHRQLLLEADTFLYGRKTYELMVPFWPDLAKSKSGTKSMNDFAQAFDAVRQIVVFSKSLESADGKTKIVRGNLRDEILKLKQEEGKNILTGGVDIPLQLIRLGLVDEYHFVVQPLIEGDGRRLFDDFNLQERLQLKLVDSKTFSSGTIALRYVKG
jgi:dihydrofolate reductase